MALSKIDDRMYVKIGPNMLSKEGIDYLGEEFLIENKIAPILNTSKGTVLAISNPDSEKLIKEKFIGKKNKYNNIKFVYCEQSLIEYSLKKFDSSKEQEEQIKYIEMLIEDSCLTLDEGITVLSYGYVDEEIGETLNKMGFMLQNKELIEA